MKLTMESLKKLIKEELQKLGRSEDYDFMIDVENLVEKHFKSPKDVSNVSKIKAFGEELKALSDKHGRPVPIERFRNVKYGNMIAMGLEKTKVAGLDIFQMDTRDKKFSDKLRVLKNKYFKSRSDYKNPAKIKKFAQDLDRQRSGAKIPFDMIKRLPNGEAIAQELEAISQEFEE